MSDRVRALIWDYYDEKRFGAPRILALALSDEADDRGGGIFQSTKELAKKTEQSDRAVQRQMRRLEESNLVSCVDRSRGGPGQFSHYRLNLSLLLDLQNPDRGSGLTPTVGRGSAPLNHGSGSGLDDAPINTYLKDTSKVDVVSVRVEDVDDQRIAAWMFERIKTLNPKHREPSWPTWRKELALMRGRDQRSRAEICALFAWANADTFWQRNILSPSALRKQWDRLVIERQARPGAAMATTKADWRCSREKAGVRCEAQGVFKKPDGSTLCRQCQEEDERERARAQA